MGTGRSGEIMVRTSGGGGSGWGNDIAIRGVTADRDEHCDEWCGCDDIATNMGEHRDERTRWRNTIVMTVAGYSMMALRKETDDEMDGDDVVTV